MAIIMDYVTNYNVGNDIDRPVSQVSFSGLNNDIYTITVHCITHYNEYNGNKRDVYFAECWLNDEQEFETGNCKDHEEALIEAFTTYVQLFA